MGKAVGALSGLFWSIAQDGLAVLISMRTSHLPCPSSTYDRAHDASSTVGHQDLPLGQSQVAQKRQEVINHPLLTWIHIVSSSESSMGPEQGIPGWRLCIGETHTHPLQEGLE